VADDEPHVPDEAPDARPVGEAAQVQDQAGQLALRAHPRVDRGGERLEVLDAQGLGHPGGVGHDGDAVEGPEDVQPELDVVGGGGRGEALETGQGLSAPVRGACRHRPAPPPRGPGVRSRDPWQGRPGRSPLPASGAARDDPGEPPTVCTEEYR